MKNIVKLCLIVNIIVVVSKSIEYESFGNCSFKIRLFIDNISLNFFELLMNWIVALTVVEFVYYLFKKVVLG